MGKITSLPRHVRDQLHRRLDDGQTESDVLPWLNALPEVQAILVEKFDSRPITAENLYQYRKRGFRRWQIQQAAFDFLADFNAPDDTPAADKLASAPLIERLVQFICLRFAAAAQNCPAAEDPQAELREVHSLLIDIVALRRGELVSRRIALEQQRLERETSKTEQELERQFWEWARRPEIAAKLSPHLDKDLVRQQVVSLIDHHFLGARNTFPLDHEELSIPIPEPDPACLV